VFKLVHRTEGLGAQWHLTLRRPLRAVFSQRALAAFSVGLLSVGLIGVSDSSPAHAAEGTRWSDSGGILTTADASSLSVNASGTGFLPQRGATVWLFSGPTLMATVTVDEDGEFPSEFFVLALPLMFSVLLDFGRHRQEDSQVSL
jgi:hypothetical protein